MFARTALKLARSRRAWFVNLCGSPCDDQESRTLGRRGYTLADTCQSGTDTRCVHSKTLLTLPVLLPPFANSLADWAEPFQSLPVLLLPMLSCRAYFCPPAGEEELVAFRFMGGAWPVSSK